jgi:hypothetical protein
LAEENERAARILKRALVKGDFSEASGQALLTAGGEEVGMHLGLPLGTDTAGEGDLLLATILIDDSPSIGNIEDGMQAVIQGHNYCLEALAEELPSDILVLTRFLNTGTVWPYQPLATAPRLSLENYTLRARTPLYRESVLTLGAVMAKAREQRDRGRRVRGFTMIVTDGEDNASDAVVVDHVRFLVRDMLERWDDYKVAGMGIGEEFRFKPIFRDMGIPEAWILIAPASAEGIRKLFRRVAKSLQLAASGDEGWRQLEAGPVLGDD